MFSQIRTNLDKDAERFCLLIELFILIPCSARAPQLLSPAGITYRPHPCPVLAKAEVIARPGPYVSKKGEK